MSLLTDFLFLFGIGLAVSVLLAAFSKRTQVRQTQATTNAAWSGWVLYHENGDYYVIRTMRQTGILLDYQAVLAADISASAPEVPVHVLDWARRHPGRVASEDRLR